MSDAVLTKERDIAERLRAIARGAYITNAFRAGQIDDIADEILAKRQKPPASTHEPPPEQWRCFHCTEVFTDHAAALEHFGSSQACDPACTIDVAEYRRMEETCRRHCEDDTDLHRALHAKDAEMHTAVRRSEEQGYARGLEDAKKHPETLGLMTAGQPPSVWQPIETAPKDGTMILTVVAGWHPGIYKWFEFEEGGGRWTPDPECFLEESHLGEWIDGNAYDPTHWMPIPKGPTATKCEGQS